MCRLRRRPNGAAAFGGRPSGCVFLIILYHISALQTQGLLNPGFGKAIGNPLHFPARGTAPKCGLPEPGSGQTWVSGVLNWNFSIRIGTLCETCILDVFNMFSSFSRKEMCRIIMEPPRKFISRPELRKINHKCKPTCKQSTETHEKIQKSNEKHSRTLPTCPHPHRLPLIWVAFSHSCVRVYFCGCFL